LKVDAAENDDLASITANLMTPSGRGQLPKNGNFSPDQLIEVEKVQVVESDISVKVVKAIITTGEDH